MKKLFHLLAVSILLVLFVVGCDPEVVPEEPKLDLEVKIDFSSWGAFGEQIDKIILNNEKEILKTDSGWPVVRFEDYAYETVIGVPVEVQFFRGNYSIQRWSYQPVKKDNGTYTLPVDLPGHIDNKEVTYSYDQAEINPDEIKSCRITARLARYDISVDYDYDGLPEVVPCLSEQPIIYTIECYDADGKIYCKGEMNGEFFLNRVYTSGDVRFRLESGYGNSSAKRIVRYEVELSDAGGNLFKELEISGAHQAYETKLLDMPFGPCSVTVRGYSSTDDLLYEETKEYELSKYSEINFTVNADEVYGILNADIDAALSDGNEGVIEYYQLDFSSASGASHESIRVKADGRCSLRVPDLKYGDWTVKASALDGLGTVIGEKSSSVTISNGPEAHISFEIPVNVEYGYLNVIIKGGEFSHISAGTETVSGKLHSSLDMIVSGNACTGSVKLPQGKYRVFVSRGTSIENAVVSVNGGEVVVLSVEDSRPGYSVSSNSLPYVHFEDFDSIGPDSEGNFSVTAEIINPSGSFSGAWYLDGVEKGTDATIELTGLPRGEHVLSYVLTDGSDTVSHSVTFMKRTDFLQVAVSGLKSSYVPFEKVEASVDSQGYVEADWKSFTWRINGIDVKTTAAIEGFSLNLDKDALDKYSIFNDTAVSLVGTGADGSPVELASVSFDFDHGISGYVQDEPVYVGSYFEIHIDDAYGLHSYMKFIAIDGEGQRHDIYGSGSSCRLDPDCREGIYEVYLLVSGRGLIPVGRLDLHDFFNFDNIDIPDMKRGDLIEVLNFPPLGEAKFKISWSLDGEVFSYAPELQDMLCDWDVGSHIVTFRAESVSGNVFTKDIPVNVSSYDFKAGCSIESNGGRSFTVSATVDFDEKDPDRNVPLTFSYNLWNAEDSTYTELYAGSEKSFTFDLPGNVPFVKVEVYIYKDSVVLQRVVASSWFYDFKVDTQPFAIADESGRGHVMLKPESGFELLDREAYEIYWNQHKLKFGEYSDCTFKSDGDLLEEYFGISPVDSRYSYEKLTVPGGITKVYRKTAATLKASFTGIQGEVGAGSALDLSMDREIGRNEDFDCMIISSDGTSASIRSGSIPTDFPLGKAVVHAVVLDRNEPNEIAAYASAEVTVTDRITQFEIDVPAKIKYGETAVMSVEGPAELSRYRWFLNGRPILDFNGHILTGPFVSAELRATPGKNVIQAIGYDENGSVASRAVPIEIEALIPELKIGAYVANDYLYFNATPLYSDDPEGYVKGEIRKYWRPQGTSDWFYRSDSDYSVSHDSFIELRAEMVVGGEIVAEQEKTVSRADIRIEMDDVAVPMSYEYDNAFISARLVAGNGDFDFSEWNISWFVDGTEVTSSVSAGLLTEVPAEPDKTVDVKCVMTHKTAPIRMEFEGNTRVLAYKKDSFPRHFDICNFPETSEVEQGGNFQAYIPENDYRMYSYGINPVSRPMFLYMIKGSDGLVRKAEHPERDYCISSIYLPPDMVPGKAELHVYMLSPDGKTFMHEMVAPFTVTECSPEVQIRGTGIYDGMGECHIVDWNTDWEYTWYLDWNEIIPDDEHRMYLNGRNIEPGYHEIHVVGTSPEGMKYSSARTHFIVPEYVGSFDGIYLRDGADSVKFDFTWKGEGVDASDLTFTAYGCSSLDSPVEAMKVARPGENSIPLIKYTSLPFMVYKIAARNAEGIIVAVSGPRIVQTAPVHHEYAAIVNSETEPVSWNFDLNFVGIDDIGLSSLDMEHSFSNSYTNEGILLENVSGTRWHASVSYLGKYDGIVDYGLYDFYRTTLLEGTFNCRVYMRKIQSDCEIVTDVKPGMSFLKTDKVYVSSYCRDESQFRPFEKIVYILEDGEGRFYYAGDYKGICPPANMPEGKATLHVCYVQKYEILAEKTFPVSVWNKKKSVFDIYCPDRVYIEKEFFPHLPSEFENYEAEWVLDNDYSTNKAPTRLHYPGNHTFKVTVTDYLGRKHTTTKVVNCLRSEGYGPFQATLNSDGNVAFSVVPYSELPTLCTYHLLSLEQDGTYRERKVYETNKFVWTPDPADGDQLDMKVIVYDGQNKKVFETWTDPVKLK